MRTVLKNIRYRLEWRKFATKFLPLLSRKAVIGLSTGFHLRSCYDVTRRRDKIVGDNHCFTWRRG